MTTTYVNKELRAFTKNFTRTWSFQFENIASWTAPYRAHRYFDLEPIRMASRAWEGHTEMTEPFYVPKNLCWQVDWN